MWRVANVSMCFFYMHCHFTTPVQTGRKPTGQFSWNKTSEFTSKNDPSFAPQWQEPVHREAGATRPRTSALPKSQIYWLDWWHLLCGYCAGVVFPADWVKMANLRNLYPLSFPRLGRLSLLSVITHRLRWLLAVQLTTQMYMRKAQVGLLAVQLILRRILTLLSNHMKKYKPRTPKLLLIYRDFQNTFHFGKVAWIPVTLKYRCHFWG